MCSKHRDLDHLGQIGVPDLDLAQARLQERERAVQVEEPLASSIGFIQHALLHPGFLPQLSKANLKLPQRNRSGGELP